MTKYTSLTETFFKEIPFKDFINSISDDTPLNNFDSNQEYYKSRYDNFFQLTNISETELKQVINSFKTKFIEDNGSFDEEVFRNSYSFGINKFIDEIQDHLNTLSKGKAHTIERCNNKFIHHFELTLDVTSGKTIIISTKNIDQIHLYFKTIKNTIETLIKERFDKPKSNLEDKDDLYIKTVKNIKNTFNSIDLEKEWEYCFTTEEDFNEYTTILADYFNSNTKVSSQKIQIQAIKGTKSKTAAILRKIYNESTEKKLKGNNDFFEIVKILSTFKDLSLEKIYDSLGK
tara:strand:- start:547 stop:1410 length:864 start_codon:yes stop_codon:yes gene_type:complete